MRADGTNILAPGLPSSRLHRRVFTRDWLYGKSYPVTAAQLLPILTEFLASTCFSNFWSGKEPPRYCGGGKCKARNFFYTAAFQRQAGGCRLICDVPGKQRNRRGRAQPRRPLSRQEFSRMSARKALRLRCRHAQDPQRPLTQPPCNWYFSAHIAGGSLAC